MDQGEVSERECGERERENLEWMNKQMEQRDGVRISDALHHFA